MGKKLLEMKYCAGCYNNHYNPGCWCRKSAKLETKIEIGIDEQPPYKGKKKIKSPSCWRGGSSRRVRINPNVLTEDGFWKS